MANYTLIPSSLTLTYSSWTNPSNAYTDTSSNTYASGTVSGSGIGTLGGFDFSVIPISEEIISLTVKIKVGKSSSIKPLCVLYSDSQNGVPLSNEVTLDSYDEKIYTFDLTADVDTIVSYASTLCVKIYSPSGSVVVYLYGAEIDIITSVVGIAPNKIIYGNNTLIDLSSDTVQKSDVASGVIFHLPNGRLAAGTYTPPVISPTKAIASSTSSTTRSLSVTGLTKEPSWFMLVCSSTSGSRSSRVMHMLYDGSTTTTRYVNGSTAGTITSSTTYGTWTYSSGTLSITVTTAYFGAADWELYYL